MSIIYSDNKDDIDFSKIFMSVFRFKKVFISIFLLSGFLSAFITSRLQMEWEGQFQIVMKNDEDLNRKPPVNNSKIVSNLISSGEDSGLKTEVKILESPSVLKPVYDYVMKLEINKNKNKDKFSYKNWFENRLDIKLLKGTKVLEITYKSYDEKTIKPVLNKISEIYQEYSGKERKKEIDRTLYFLEGQLESTRKKSSISMNKLQAFSIENNLGNSDGIPSSVEVLEINPNMNDSVSRFQEQFRQLSALENQLAIKSSLLTSDSQIIKNLKRNISSLKNSLSRPKEILIKYRELRRDALRDEATLSLIEGKINTLLLQKTLDLNPWELISEPTVLWKDLEKTKTDFFLAGILISILFGIISSYLAQKISGKIYSYKEIIEIVDLPLLKTLKTFDSSKWEGSFKLLLDGPLLKKKDEKIGILSVGDLSSSIIFEIQKTFSSYLNINSVEVVNNLSDLKKYNKKLVIFGSGLLTKEQLFSFKEEYNLCKFEIEGALFFDV